MNVKKSIGFIGLIIILLALLSVSLFFVSCNSDVLVTVHTDRFGDIVWNSSEQSFDSLISTFDKVENYRPVYYFDADFTVRADVSALTADKLKKANCKDVYIKWAICEHTSAKNLSNGIDATCSTEGKRPDYLCPTCGHVEVGESIPCIPHSFISFSENPATCTEVGQRAHKECKICHYLTDVNEEEKLTVNDVIIPMVDHIQGDWIIDKKATCYESGSRHTQCIRCKEIITTEVVSALGHDYINHAEQAPTCTDVGWKAYVTCSRCDYSTKVELPAAHVIEHVSAKLPTCTEYGYNAYDRCTNCDYSTLELIKPLEHNYKTVSAKAPTCMDSGWNEYKVCTREGCDYKDGYIEIAALGHSLEYVDKKEPLCYEPGHNAYEYCKRCSYTTYEELTVDHSIIHHDAKEPTCLDLGWFAYDTCARTGCTYSTKVERAALGHDDGEWVVDVAPTCIKGGSNHLECTRCKILLSEGTLEPIGHDPINHSAQAPTCTDVGWNDYQTCSRCDYSTYVEKSALGHDNGVWTIDTQPTCTEVGSEDRKCGRCQYVLETREIEVLGHDPINHSAKAPTCTEDGWNDYVSCSRCNYSTYQVVSALGHIDGQWVEDVAPTCIKEGSKHLECARCEASIKTEKIDALGHDTINHSAKDAMCTSIGWNDYQTCSRCDYTTYSEISALGHDFVNCICSRCSLESHIQDGKFCRHDNYIYFGTYPQSEVTDESLTSVLTTQAGSLPTANNSANWTSYGYYIEGKVTDFMWYIDLYYNAEQYRGVYFTSYRPDSTEGSSLTDNSYQDDNGYYISTVYWFKYDPIKWRILSESNGEALVFCEMIIDSQDYYSSTSSRTIDGVKVYPSNYAYSNIRTFLNETFYSTAFSMIQSELILLTDVDNSERSTSPDTSIWNNGINSYACSNTNDYIFLLSEQEISATRYGFSTSTLESDTRTKAVTPYAKCQGAWMCTASEFEGNGFWWLRSPNCSGTGNLVRVVNETGLSRYDCENTCISCGVVPALRIELIDHSKNGLAYTLSSDKKYYSVSGIGTCEETSIVIPSTYKGLPVKAIRNSAFKNITSIKSITIMNSVTSIGEDAFYGCTNLTSITIGNGVKTIGSSAFRNCTNLARITIPVNVTSIDSKAFTGCFKLVEVYNLSSLSIEAGSNGYGNIGYYAKVVHTSKDEESDIRKVDDFLFITSDDTNYLVGYVGDGIEITLPDDYNGESYEINKGAFDGTSLTSITIPNNVTSIGSYAFYGCTRLTSVSIGNGVTSIGSYAFWGCTSLSTIMIPSSITSIDSKAFTGCFKLVEVYNLSSLTLEVGSNSYGFVGYYAKLLHTSKDEESIVKRINDFLFITLDNANYLIGYIGDETDVILPDNYNGESYEISQYAFRNCTGLTSIIIPDSVTIIGEEAFYGCDRITSIIIPDSVTTIGENAFV